MRGRFVSLVGLALVVTACGATSTETTTNAVAAVPESTPTTGTVTAPSATSSTADAPTTTASAGSDVGTRENPVASGTPAQVGEDWIVTVVSATPDATAAILAENQFNDPPAEGDQFFLVSLEAVYVGDTSGTFWLETTLKALGISNVAYEFDAICGVIPNAMSDVGETFPGGTAAGTECWAVQSDDAASLLLIIEPAFSFSDDDRVFFATQSGIGSPGEATPPSTDAGAGGELGARANPVPLGSPAQVGEWLVSVLSVTPNATEKVLAENQFNDPPEEGHQFFVVEFEATYVGETSGTFWLDVNRRALGASNVAYEFDATCGVIPDAISDAGETFPEGTIVGNECWSIEADDVGSLLLIIEPSFSIDDEDRFFFATQ
ncbi:MAG TPA: hypothetical protein VGC11_13430 [Acidimicrobiia bacterium]|jgi:hypothetical protein